MGTIRKNKGLTIAQQKIILEQVYPNSKVYFAGHNKIIWQYELKPTELSICYRVKMVFDGISPKVYVVNPNPLQLAEGKNELPHVYDNKKQQLCLYFKDWNKTMPLAKTVVPWIADWLFYYEIWLYTRIWEGGGIHPQKNKPVKIPK